MLEAMLAAVGGLAVLVAASMRVLRKAAVTPPLLALLLGVVVGPEALGLVELPPGEEVGAMHTATRLLLAVALMAIALRYPIREVRRVTRPVAVLLLVVMPAMAAAVSLVGGVVLGLPAALAIALGAALSPTDPVLASGVVTGDAAEADVPPRLRRILSLESGANDGLALPLVVVGVALVTGSSALAATGRGALQVVVGIALGAVMGIGAGWLVRTSERRGDIEHEAMALFTLVLALAILGVIGLARGDAVLGVFVAGLVYSRIVTGRDRAVEARMDEALNQFLVLPVFALLGVVAPWQGWLDLGWRGVAFVTGVLLLRRLPWILLMARPLRLGWRDAVWLGWFGPIGVAAVFYLGHLHAHGVVHDVVWHAGTLVVVASTVAHGITQPAGRRLLAASGEG